MSSLITIKEDKILIEGTKHFDVHEKVKGLLWIYEPHLEILLEKIQLSYTNNLSDVVKINNKYDEFKEKFRKIIEDFRSSLKETSNKNEPSLIYPFLPITPVADINKVDRPPYFPNYSQLTPEQRYCYLEYLKNPYNTQADLGYVFLFLYGVERFLFTKKVNEAIEMIFKLRETYKDNNSFYRYSTRTLLFFSVQNKNLNLYNKVINSIDDTTRYIDHNSLLYFKIGMQIGLTPEEIYAYNFNSHKYKYIRKYKDRFIVELGNLFKETFGTKYINISSLISAKEISCLSFTNSYFTANRSIEQSKIKIPFFYQEYEIDGTVSRLKFFETIEEMSTAACEIIKEQNKLNKKN